MIGIMTLRHSSVYFQCHPLLYLIKLHIEMNMAELVVKIRKSAQRREVNNWDDVFFPTASPHDMALQATPVRRHRPSVFAKFHRGPDTEMELAAIEEDTHQLPPPKQRQSSFFHLPHLGRDDGMELIDMPEAAVTSAKTWASDRATVQGSASQDAAERDPTTASPDVGLVVQATGDGGSPSLAQREDAHSASQGDISLHGTDGDMEISPTDHDDSSVRRLAQGSRDNNC